MKPTVRLKIVFFLLCMALCSGRATFSQVAKDSTGIEYKKKIKYLQINMSDEKHFVKIATVALISQNVNDYWYSGRPLLITYERKIGIPWSIYINNKSYNNNGSFATNGFNTSLSIGGRYYFTLMKKIKNGVSGNNMNGPYVDCNIDGFGYFFFEKYGFLSLKSPFIVESRLFGYYFNPIRVQNITLSTGLQRRINSYLFYDIFFFCNYSLPYSIEYNTYSTYNKTTIKESFQYGINLKLGFGYASK